MTCDQIDFRLANFQMGQQCQCSDIGKERVFENLSLWLKQLPNFANGVQLHCTLLKSTSYLLGPGKFCRILRGGWGRGPQSLG